MATSIIETPTATPTPAAEPTVLTIFQQEIRSILYEELNCRLSDTADPMTTPRVRAEDRIIHYLITEDANEEPERDWRTGKFITPEDTRPYLLRLAEAMKTRAGQIESAYADYRRATHEAKTGE